MTKLLQSKWMVVLAGGLLYWLVTVVTWQMHQPALAGSMAPEAPRSGERSAGAYDVRNPELDQLIEELKQEKERLAAREKELEALAARLKAERLEINQVTQAVHQLQSAFDQKVLSVQTEEVANLKKLAKMYAAMTPESAASIVKELDDDSIVKILLYMKDTQSATILEALAKQSELLAKRAAGLSERIRLSAFRKPVATPQ